MLYLQQEVWSKLAGLSVRKTPLLFVKSVQGGGHLIHSNPVLITSRYKPSIMLNLVLLLIQSNFYSGERCSRSLGNFSTLTLHFAIISDFLVSNHFPLVPFHCSLCLSQKRGFLSYESSSSFLYLQFLLVAIPSQPPAMPTFLYSRC